MVDLKRLFPAKPSQGQAVVDIGASGVKWLYVETQQNKSMVRYFRYKPAEGVSDEDISVFINDCFTEFKIADRRAICCIPSSSFITKSIDMPSSDPEEIRKIVTLHAGRYTPYSREEIIIDYLTMQIPGQHYTNVLLVIVNRMVADRFLSIFAGAGVDITKMAVPSEAMGYMYKEWLLGEKEDSAIGGAVIDQDATDVTMLDRNQINFIRNIPIGAKHLMENYDGIKEDFLKEIKTSVSTYLEQGVGRAIGQFVITGLADQIPNLENDIRTQKILDGGATPLSVKFVPYLERAFVSEEVLEVLESSKNVCIFDLIATMSSLNALRLDLMPDEVKLRRRVREGGKDMISLGMIIMTCMLLICIFLATKIYLRHVRIEKIEEKYEQTSREARMLESASTKTRVLRELLETRGKGLYVFEKLSSMISDDIYLSGFSHDREGEVTIRGTADSMSRVFAFVSDLEDSLFFKDVEASETKTRKEKGEEVADFTIQCTFAELEE